MKYNVLATYTYQKFLGTFEADSEEEAIEKACDTLSCTEDIHFCHSCTDNFIDYPTLCEDEWVTEEVE